ncbi:MAG TPA: hypothetical protein VIV11_21375 [Kofleriaceae bacterium]
MGPTTSAVDLPRPRVDLALGRRRHRRITGPAGLLLFVCLFLPAVKGCNEPVYPLAMPMFWHPYIYGAVLALGSAALTVRHLHYTVVALRIVAWLTIVGSAFLIAIAGGVALAELIVGALLLAAIGRRGYSERRVAATAIAIGVISLLWFGLWVTTPEAMVGVYVSALASAGVFVGGLVWLVETS